ncbi:MAG: hypothetical protein ACHQFW_04645 [Chitinophagales bacterium]
MKRKYILPICILLLSFMVQSCQEEVLPDKKKVTYRVDGTDYSVTFTRSDGVNETYYNMSGVFKQDVFANIGEPVLLLARGTDDLDIRIIFGHGVDTVRTSSDTGTDLVFIETIVPEVVE